jgi:tetratricopeptide (TPR) repeat protein
MTDAPTTPDPIEIAMEAEASGRAPAGQASALLADQRRLIAADLMHRRWQIASERAGFGLRVLTGIAGLAVAVMVGVMVWTASRADGLIIEAIEAPPELVAQGFTGQALAAQLQDRLGRMQRETRTAESATNLREARDAEVRIQIPNTGVSLGEVDRWLRGWLGHETAVRGELVKPPSGLALTVRVGALPGAEVTSATGDVGELLQKGAEAVYRARDPRRYLTWLRQQGRSDVTEIAQAMAQQGAAKDRAEALAFLASGAGAGDVALARRATRLDPDNCYAWNALYTSSIGAGHAEAALQAALRAQACDRKARRAGLAPGGYERFMNLDQMNVEIARQERWPAIQRGCVQISVSPCTPAAILAAAQAGLDVDETDGNFALRLPVITRIMAPAHAGSYPVRLAALQRPPAEASPADQRYWLLTAGYAAVGAEDWAAVVSVADQVDALDARIGRPKLSYGKIWRPYALARIGRMAEADAAAAALPADCYPCVVVRGKLAALKGDRAGAERWFAEAVRQAPSIPQAYVEWGASRLAGGDADGAIVQAKKAHAASPHNPEALELWAEALAARGDADGAAAKFTEAAREAPFWGRLHVQWAEALAKAGRAGAARAMARTAAGLELTAAERAELAKVAR